MDRNDAGIVRSMLAQCAAIIARTPDRAGQALPLEVVGRILESGARMHDVVRYSTISLRLTREITVGEAVKFFTEQLASITGVQGE